MNTKMRSRDERITDIIETLTSEPDIIIEIIQEWYNYGTISINHVTDDGVLVDANFTVDADVDGYGWFRIFCSWDDIIEAENTVR